MRYIISVVVLVGLFLAAGWLDFHDWRSSEVTSVDGCLVTATDKVGNEWVFDDEGFSVGDRVVLVFHNQGTEEPYDDVIENVIRK